jgi:hypothetical protein
MHEQAHEKAELNSSMQIVCDAAYQGLLHLLPEVPGRDGLAKAPLDDRDDSFLGTKSWYNSPAVHNP